MSIEHSHSDFTPEEEARIEHRAETTPMSYADAEALELQARRDAESSARLRKQIAEGALHETVKPPIRPKSKPRRRDTPGEPRDPNYPIDTTGQLAPDQQAGWRMVRDAGKKPQ